MNSGNDSSASDHTAAGLLSPEAGRAGWAAVARAAVWAWWPPSGRPGPRRLDGPRGAPPRLGVGRPGVPARALERRPGGGPTCAAEPRQGGSREVSGADGPCLRSGRTGAGPRCPACLPVLAFSDPADGLSGVPRRCEPQPPLSWPSILRWRGRTPVATTGPGGTPAGRGRLGTGRSSADWKAFSDTRGYLASP